MDKKGEIYRIEVLMEFCIIWMGFEYIDGFDMNR